MMRSSYVQSQLILCMLVLTVMAALPAVRSSADVTTTTAPAGDSSRETLSLDRGWRFHLGDIPHSAFKANGDEAEGGGKGAAAWGAAAPGFDDKTWRTLNVPHDWVVEQPFDEKAVRNQGYRKRGIGWYRRTFKLDQSDRGKHIELQFDGVATHSTVWVNGSLVHRNWNGYTSYQIDITPMAQYGDAVNTIAVRVDANAMEGWWYEGGGIYRHTWLVKRSPVHIITDGIYANPVKDANGQWTIPFEATLQNSGRASVSAGVQVQVADPQGKTVATADAVTTIDPWRQAVVKLSIPVESPKLWSIDQPNLYTVKTQVVSDGKTDEVSTHCGFRTIRFDVEKGLFLNDQHVILQGVCNHQDHAGVGVAVPDALLEFRLRKLKEMGVNAYRTAHNPPSKELLDLCDRMGLLVMDENRHFNTSAECLGQLEWLVRRDRNHPSVILWSLFNEENALQGTEQGREMTRRMVAAVKALDATRPVTAGMNKGQLIGEKVNPNSAAHELDVVGVNYQVAEYDLIRAAYPDKPIVSTEDTSQVMTRGAFVTDWDKLILASYDEKYPGWASSSHSAWAAIASQPSFAGGFCWTGFDYRGEPSPFGWPAVSSYFGCMDLCGFPKTSFYIRQALWVHEKPILTLVPHWNWEGKEGQPVRVMAITNADTVSLSLNGKLVEEKPVVKFAMVSWEVPYTPGRIEAVAKKGGQEVARSLVETTGQPARINLTADRSIINADGEDVAVFTVTTLDAKGRVVPLAKNKINFTIDGPGIIIGVGNGDPTCHEPETYVPAGEVPGKAEAAPWSRSLFNGLAQVIVQSGRTSGEFTLRASADGLTPGTAVVQTRPCTLRPE